MAREMAGRGQYRSGDRLAHLTVSGSALILLSLTILLFWELWRNAAPTRRALGWSFITTSLWDPVSNSFGALPFLYGTIITSAVALAIAVPIGIGSAIFLAELAPRRISDALTFLIELLAAVPSVIYGLLGIFVLLPFLSQRIVPALKAVLGFLPIFSGPFYGVSFFSAGVVLAIMVVPFIVSVSREVMLAVPDDQRAASLALGATQWETTWRVVLPYGARGIFGGIFLALARALGETMAVTMVIGNTPQISKSLLSPGYSTAAVIANEFTEATGKMHISALIELGLLLFVMTIVINALARLLIMTTGWQTK